MRAFLRRQINRFPRAKALIKHVAQVLFPSRWASARYEQMQGVETELESARLRSAWKSEDIPAKQRELVERQLAGYRRGVSVDNFDVLVNALQTLETTSTSPISVLEVGCSSGYYSEVFEIAGLNVTYAGCDYSDAFIKLARQCYPKLPFDVQDATALKYGNNAFETVISGGCLLHIPEYETAVAETARVSSRYAIFHRTPVVIGQPNKYFRKLAYGVETVEIHFNEPAFLALLARCGLELIGTHTLDENVIQGVGSATRTYVCRKQRP